MAGRDRNGACSSWLCTLALTAGFLGLRFFLPGVSNSPHGACPVLLAGAGDAGLEVFVHVQSGLLPQALGGVEENIKHGGQRNEREAVRTVEAVNLSRLQ